MANSASGAYVPNTSITTERNAPKHNDFTHTHTVIDMTISAPTTTRPTFTIDFAHMPGGVFVRFYSVYDNAANVVAWGVMVQDANYVTTYERESTNRDEIERAYRAWTASRPL